MIIKSVPVFTWSRFLPIAKLHLAWELATSPYDRLRDGKEALELLDSEDDKYVDEVRILETTAAVYAELGNYEKAVKFQQKAIDEASDLEWDIPLLNQRLALYKAEAPYRGSYF